MFLSDKSIYYHFFFFKISTPSPLSFIFQIKKILIINLFTFPLLFHKSRIGSLTPIQDKHETSLRKEKKFKECYKINVYTKTFLVVVDILDFETLLKNTNNLKAI